MEYLYCPNCGKMTGHKRALGWGTFFGGIITMGASTLAIPLYPIRCIICGRESSGHESEPQNAESYETFDSEIPRSSESQERDTKKCPFCAELIKLEAIKCRFCGEKFDPADEARFKFQVLCRDGNCIGVIGPDGLCKECGLPYGSGELINSVKKRPKANRITQAEIDESNDLKRCPYCGAKNQIDNKTCLSCCNSLS